MSRERESDGALAHVGIRRDSSIQDRGVRAGLGEAEADRGYNPADTLCMRYPASWWRNMWREALPSGNGVVGASVFGGVREETVLLNHARLWHWGQKDELPDVSHVLAETRAMMDAGQYQEASWLLANALKERGYGTKLASRFPLAAIRLFMPGENAFRSYRRKLFMDSGEVEVSWQDGNTRFNRRLFVSRADDAVVYEISSDREAAVSGEIGLVLHPSDRWSEAPEFKKLEQSVERGSALGEDASAGMSSAGDSSAKSLAAFSWFSATNDDGTDYGAVMAVRADGGEMRVSDGSVQFKAASRVTVWVRVFVQGERKGDWAKLRGELATMAEQTSYSQLLQKHIELHRPLYRSASLELGAADNGNDGQFVGGMERDGEETRADGPFNEQLLLDAYEGEAPISLVRRMWAYGRYLFISGTDSSADAEPFGLYGLWGGDYRLVWSHNMANENVQMMYWHAHVGGLGGLTPALFRYYESLMEDFRGNARKLYGCGGIYIPAGTTAGIGVPNQIVPVILNWTGAAAWLARHYYERYQFTGDVDFLKDRAIPFMLEAAKFYEDFLVPGDSGEYRIYPSVSPENTPQNFMPADGAQLAHPMPTAINATMDVALIRELFTNLLEASEHAGTATSTEKEKWKLMLERLPAYTINEDGAAEEWLHPDFEDRYAHRHLSHLYPVFPGNEVMRETRLALFEAFERAVRKREIGAQSGWSLTHMAAIYARLGDGDRALDCLDILSRSGLLPNLFTLHNDWRGMGVSMNMPTAPVQLDANMGWVNAVQEMLLQVTPEMIKLLPALPERLPRGKLSGWRFHTGELSMEWDRASGSFRAELRASRDTRVIVKLPDWAANVVMAGGDAALSELGESYRELRLLAGESAVAEAGA